MTASTSSTPPSSAPTKAGWSVARWSLLLLGLIGAAGIAAALFSQYVLDMAPCTLCYWQRYPYYAAMVAVPLALMPLPRPVHGGLALLTGLLIAGSGVIGLYHGGVEQGWFEGPSGCSSTLPMGLSPDELLEAIRNKPLVRCDEPAELAFGVSMPWWNAAYAFGAVILSPVVATVLIRLRKAPSDA